MRRDADRRSGGRESAAVGALARRGAGDDGEGLRMLKESLERVRQLRDLTG